MYVFTWLDGGDVCSSGVPLCLEAKVSTAVGLLVETDPHVSVALLHNTHTHIKNARLCSKARERITFVLHYELLVAL
jgi:hypothetical protein